MIRTLIALLPPGSRPRVTGYLMLTALSVLLRAAAAVLLVPFVAGLFAADPHQALPWLGWLTATTAGGWIVDFAASRIGFRIGFGVLESSQRDLADRLPQVQLPWFTAENTATTRAAIGATGPELLGMIVYLMTPLIGAMALPAVIAVALLVTVSVPLGLAALAGVVVLLAAMWASIRLSRNADKAADATNAELTERIIEFARTQAALRAARRVTPARSLAGAALEAQHGATMRLLGMQVPGQVLFSLASQLALVLFAGAAAVLTVRHQLGAPEAVALIVVLVRYLEPFTALSELAPGIDTTRATLRRIQTVLDAPTLESGTDAAGNSAPRIEFDAVGFGYAGGDRVLDDVSFTLEPGTTTAIVGPSGSGKSTVLSLIAGLYQPDRGAVRFDGVDLAQMDPEARRAAVSMVFQHSYLFDGSIAENVLVGRPDADDAALAEAFGLARVDELLDRLPDGAQSAAGEGGSALSGGERQRVGIARALLKPAPVLLVDEATSALDTENEAAIVAALTGDARPRTRVIVAHRLASISGADRVLFVQDGRIVEDGGIDELLAAGGRFADFWDQRRAAADWQVAH